MKISKFLSKYARDLTEVIVAAYRSVIESEGETQVKVYIWEDGEIETLEQPCGSNSGFVPADGRHYVCTISEPFFNVWDAAGVTPPDDEESEEFDREWEAAVDWLVEEYKRSCADEVIDDAIKQASYYE